MSVVLAIPDLHSPFQHKDALAFLKDLKRIYKPERVVCLGDEVDFHTLSQWPKDPNGFSQTEELERALEFLAELYKIFPRVQSCESNHTMRPYRMSYKNGLAKLFLKEYRQFLKAPDSWEWADRFEIDGVEYFHGEGIGSGVAAYKGAVDSRHCSCVVGHLHSSAGVVYFTSSDRTTRFCLNAGCLIDPAAYAFSYGSASKVKPTLGAGIIIHGEKAIFEPMV